MKYADATASMVVEQITSNDESAHQGEINTLSDWCAWTTCCLTSVKNQGAGCYFKKRGDEEWSR